MNRRPRKYAFALLLLLICAAIAAAQEPPLRSITYNLSMSRPVSHLFEVAIIVELPDDLKDNSIQLQMAKWSPGRYGVFDFAKNVQEFRAVAATGAKLPVTRVDDQTWSVATLGSTTLTINYKVFGNDLDGTFSQLDTCHANYNGASIFMYVVDHKPDPVKLKINPRPVGRSLTAAQIVHAKLNGSFQTGTF
jgi:predicted metalloprotease with PDZ domain